jgi:hypothetical protein
VRRAAVAAHGRVVFDLLTSARVLVSERAVPR